MEKEIIIDGNNFSDRFGFDLEIKRKLTNNLDWVNYEKSKKDLGKEETILHLREILKSCHESAVVSVKLQITELENNKGETLFNTIIKIISDHKSIELELK